MIWILYLVFGKNLDVHLQVEFSIITLLHELTDEDKIHVITTNPSFYNHLKEKINLITISEQTIQSWETICSQALSNQENENAVEINNHKKEQS